MRAAFAFAIIDFQCAECSIRGSKIASAVSIGSNKSLVTDIIIKTSSGFQLKKFRSTAISMCLLKFAGFSSRSIFVGVHGYMREQMHSHLHEWELTLKPFSSDENISNSLMRRGEFSKYSRGTEVFISRV